MRDKYITFLERQASVFELALEECIKQFDYSNNRQWREELKSFLVDIAKEQHERKNAEQPSGETHS
jgi:hypothetical protein